MSFYENTGKPEGLAGWIWLNRMNKGHVPLADWAFEHMEIEPDDHILDIGCGGGANIRRMLRMAPKGHVKGVDYSPVSVETSLHLNEEAVKAGHCEVVQGNVRLLPFQGKSFHVATAFETVYFWTGLEKSFQEVYRILKPRGRFLICNALSAGSEDSAKWMERVPGMQVYKPIVIAGALKKAGFENIRLDQKENGWLCVTCTKPEKEVLPEDGEPQVEIPIVNPSILSSKG